MKEIVNKKEKVASVFNRIEDIRLRAKDVLNVAAFRSVDNDDEEAEKVLRDGAAEIAAMALELCPPSRLAEVADAFKEKIAAKPSYLEFCRVKLARFGAPGQPTTLIGKRVNPNCPCNRAQIFKVEVARKTAVSPARATSYENGEELFTLESHSSHASVEYAAVKALKAFLHFREYHHKDLCRRRKAKRAAKRAAKEAAK